jgi:hypothetical protein
VFSGLNRPGGSITGTTANRTVPTRGATPLTSWSGTVRQEVEKPSASRRFWRLWGWAVSPPATPCQLLRTFSPPPFAPQTKANPYDNGRRKGLATRPL